MDAPAAVDPKAVTPEGSGALPLQEAINSLQESSKTNLVGLDPERIADLIDAVCEAAEKDNEDTILEITSGGTVDILLNFFSSGVPNLMKVSLAGLERLLTSEDLAISAIEAGAFETFSKVFNDSTDPYTKLKASSIIVLILISDYEKGLKLVALQNGVFEAHLALLHPSAGGETEDAVLRFLFAISEDCPGGQEKLVNSTPAIGFLLDMIKKQQYQALGPFYNLLYLEGLKSKLPVSEILPLLRPLLNENDAPEIDDVNFDRVVLVLANLVDSEKEEAATHEVLLEQLQDMAFAVWDGSLVTCGLLPVLSGLNNLLINDQNKLSVGNTEFPKLLLDILQKQGPFIFPPLEEGEEASDSGEDEDSGEIKAAAAKAILNLAFYEANRKKLESSLPAIHKIVAQEENLKVKRSLEECIFLFKEFTNRTESSSSDKNQASSASENSASASSQTNQRNTNRNPQIESWSVEDVQQWLIKVGLVQYGAIFLAQRIDGRALAEIAHNICDFRFLEMVEKRLEFHLFGDLMVFVHAVKKYT